MYAFGDEFMAHLVLFLFASVGMTNIVVDGAIFGGVRTWLSTRLPPSMFKVFQCYQCAGMWCGMICGAMVWNWWNPFVIFACGLAGSFAANFTALFFNYLEARSIVTFEEVDPNKKAS
jgi:hypothetical protein